MKLIRPNNRLSLIRIKLLLIGWLLISFSARAQNVNTDTSDVEVSDTAVDSTTTEETPNYFDYKTYGVQSDTIELRHVPSSVVDSLKSDDAFWYANAKLKKKKQESEKVTGTPKWLKVSVWALIVGAFLAALVWYLVSSNIVIFAKGQKTITPDKDDEEIDENIFRINYQREIEKAMAAENYRLAIRMMFLRLLRNLSNKNLIHYGAGKTNFDYLSQLFSTGYYNDFFRLTRHYEFVWYGKFDVSQEAFGAIKNEFENFDRKLK